MDRLTRKSLKTDKFAVEVGQTLEFLEEHRKPATIIGVAVLVVIIGAIGAYYYTQSQHSLRQTALKKALATFQAQVSPTPDNPFILTFPTEEEKNAAVTKAFTEIIEQYPGSDEAIIATYYLGVSAGNQGQEDEAVKYFREVIDSGKQPYASQAAFSLAKLKAALGDQDEAEKLLRDLIEHPTVLVSKEQAAIALARVLGQTNPAEARKLLEPLRGERSAVSRAALNALGELPQAE